MIVYRFDRSARFAHKPVSMLWVILWRVALCGYQLTSLGYYEIAMIENQVVEILMNTSVTVVVRFRPQESEFLQARIEAVNKSVCYNLSPRENVVLSGSIIRLWVIGKEFPPQLEIWVMQTSMCQSIAFEMPNASDVVMKLHADNIFVSTCVFFSGDHVASPIDVFYGFVADDDQAHLEIYSSHGMKLVTPRYVCLSAFCKAHISFQGFARLRILRGMSPSSASAFIEVVKSNAFPSLNEYPTPVPLPFYNFTGKYIVGHEFNTKSLAPAKHIKNRSKYTMILSVAFTVIMATAVVVRIVSMIAIIGRDNYAPHSMTSVSGPTRVVLNQYCPNTSAVIVVPPNRD